MNNLLLPAVAAGLLLGAHAGRAALIGDRVDLQARSPNQSTTAFDYGTRVVSSGVEYTIADTGQFSVDYAASTITVTFATSGTFTPSSGTSFFGLETTDLTNAFTATSLVSSGVTGFNSTNLFLSNGGIFLNLANVRFTANSQIVINAANAMVPEPASFTLIGAGLLGLAVSRRRVA